MSLCALGDPCNAFVLLCELKNGTSGEAIATALLTELNALGLTADLLKARLLGFCTDGASNLHGCVKGALQLISRELNRNNIITFHCMNHKLELALHDAVSSVNMVSHLRTFMDTLYAYYSRSPEHSRQLEAISSTLGIEMRKIGRIFDVRWLSSSYQTVDAVYKSLPALVAHLLQSAEKATTSKDRAKAQGMAKKMQSWLFVVELGLMRDLLEVLKSLSLFLQSRSATIMQAKSRLDSVCLTLKAMKTADSITLSDVKKQIEETGKLHDMLVLPASQKDIEQFTQVRAQFIQALVDNLTSRFPDRQLLEAGAILNPQSWPEDELERALYGDKEVLHMSNLCQVDQRQVLEEFRRYKSDARDIGKGLSKLMERVQLLPISSADCERGFSCMNINDTPVRNRLSIESLSSLIFLKVNGPEPSAFDPSSYVEKWLREGHHASTDAPTGKKKEKAAAPSPWCTLFK